MAKKTKPQFTVVLADPNSTPVEDLKKVEGGDGNQTPLVKSILNVLNGGANDSIERLAFEQDPAANNSYQSVYKAKNKLIPDMYLKRIAIQDDLVAAILNARANQMFSFGRERKDRFSTGFEISLNREVEDSLNDEQKKKVQEGIKKLNKSLLTCGQNAGWSDKEQMSFSQFLYMITRNGLTVGRIAVEVIWVQDATTGKRKFHSFRPIDAGTIYSAVPQVEAAEQVRKEARFLLEQIHNEKLEPERFENDEYSWIQVIEGRPLQAFTPEECLVHYLYPVADVELEGYPITPLDTAIAAVTTHINITTHNKLYFQNGRAARGMLVVKSEDIDDSITNQFRQHFQASVNNVNNSWRMPVFGIGANDDITWQAIESGGRDMEFQYLSDNNARVILSAFQMSPEELPGYAHLSRGTNNQALCLAKESVLLTDSGPKTIDELLASGGENVRLWSGKAWVDARVFLTGNKRKVVTTLSNGSVLATSPDHRFLHIGKAGGPEWAHQRDLGVGSTVLVGRKPVSGTSEAPSYNGKPLSEDMMEVLGWLTGDGNISVRYNKSTGNIKQGVLSFFYHHEKEEDVWRRHSEILSSFGLDVKSQKREVSDEESAAIKQRYGFDSAAPTRLKNIVYDTDFVKWLLSVGFTSSTDGKGVPDCLFTMPIGHREAFLRGLFSADGTVDGKSGAVRVVIHSDSLREQVRQLLQTVGIRTQLHQGLFKQDIHGSERTMVRGSTTLCVKDKDRFWDGIGFVQDAKNARKRISESKTWDYIPASVTKVILAGVEWSAEEPNAFRSRDNGCSRPVLERLLAHYGIAEPSWLDDYYYEEVASIVDSGAEIEMADVEVFDSEHAFSTQGVIVHNSESNSEYKLEAHRDLGIRPLMASLEDFINTKILPLIDPDLSKIVSLKLAGLDADTPEKEAVRLQQDAPIHMTYDEILQKVNKKPVGAEWAGSFPLNQQYQAILDKYFTVGEIMEHFFHKSGASRDPKLAYVRDPFYFQNLQLQMQAQQMQQQAQAQQQQAQAQAQQPQEGEGEGQETPVGKAAGEAQEALGKAEHRQPSSRKRIGKKQAKLVEHIMSKFNSESEKAIKEIVAITKSSL